jgi:hypothetical protein
MSTGRSVRRGGHRGYMRRMAIRSGLLLSAGFFLWGAAFNVQGGSYDLTGELSSAAAAKQTHLTAREVRDGAKLVFRREQVH